MRWLHLLLPPFIPFTVMTGSIIHRYDDGTDVIHNQCLRWTLMKLLQTTILDQKNIVSDAILLL